MPSLRRRGSLWTPFVALGSAFVLASLPQAVVRADGTPQALPLAQSWSTVSLITASDNWSGVPGIIGYRGDDLTTATGTNPQTLLADGTSTPVNVIANQTNPNTLATGGVAEFDAIANPTVALNGSGTADAPFLLISVSTLGKSSVTVAYNLRDLDASGDNSVQQVALHYRVGASGPFTNLPAGYVADATSGPSLATLVTPVSVALPTSADNQPLVQIRIMTTNAVGNDEWVGIDDLSVTGADVSSTDLTATGTASPSTVFVGGTSLLTVSVTPGSDPASTGVQVSADLSPIGGPPAQAFSDNGGNSFSLPATVIAGTPLGPTSILVTVSDAEGRTTTIAITLTVELPPLPVGHPVISQIYGGGGNSGATFLNDYLELYNPGTSPVDVTGWSVQYASATGAFSASNTQPLAGVIGPGEYYLVSLASGGAVGADLPLANVSGDINMSATTGKVALVSNGDPVTTACPPNDPDIVDFVGYGSANCREGAANAPAPSNTTALFRDDGGATDTDQNGGDFAVAAPSPRRTAPIAEVGPRVQLTDPRLNDLNAPRDASVTITFSEPVDVAPGWFHIACVTTGVHDDATVAGAGKTFVITPNTNFLAGESCSVVLFKDFVHDLDTDDAGPNTDTLPADYSWTFTVATGAAPAYPPEVHLTMGNPSGALPNLDTPNNYLMEKPELALSYNRDRGTPNWVSWHLDDTWVGNLVRVDTFRPDPAVPSDWYRVQATDFFSTGFDRGHMTPNADRDNGASIPINQATFLMTNMVPQAPDNNQGPWANLENYLRTLLPANELYIVSGGAGTGGTGSNGFATTVAGGHVTVPAQTWKVALVLPKDPGDDVSRVGASTRTLAVVMPNAQGIRTSNPNDWEAYLTTVDAVEALTGYDFFSNVEEAVQNSIEAGFNGTNPPGAADQLVTGEEDTPAAFTLHAVSPHAGALTYVIDTAPAHGAVTGSDAARTYTPAADFSGTDSFRFHVSDGVRTSNTATVTVQVLEVNDAPTAGGDTKATEEDVTLEFPAGELTTNDTAGPAGEAGQTLTVTSVAAAADTHGIVALAAGQVIYVPELDFHGTATFTYQVCDDGFSAGLYDPRCATGSVAVVVAPQNDAPVLTSVPGAATTPELTPYTFTAHAFDADGQALAFSLIGAPSGAAIHPTTGQFSWTPTEAQGGTGVPYAFKVRVSDGLASADATVVVTVTELNQAPALVLASHYTVSPGATLTFTAVGSDSDLPAQALGYGLSGAVPAGAAIHPVTGVFTWTPTAAQSAATYAFNVFVTDGALSTPAAVTVDVASPTPREMEQGVLAAVKALRQTTTDRSDRRKLDEIIADLSEAVYSTAWVNGSHLKPGRGTEVFDDTQRAAEKLDRLQCDRQSTIPDATLQRFIDPLVLASRRLAETAIREATGSCNPGDLARANRELAEGNRDAAHGRPGDAIGHYGAGWRFATRRRG